MAMAITSVTHMAGMAPMGGAGAAGSNGTELKAPMREAGRLSRQDESASALLVGLLLAMLMNKKQK